MRPALFMNDFHTGGAERLVLDLAMEMSRGQNVNPRVIVGNQEGALRTEFERAEIPWDSLDANISPKGIPAAVRSLRRTLSNTNVNLVHSHLPFSHVVSRVATARLSVHNVSTYHNVRNHKTLPRRIAERTTRPQTDGIVCVSDCVRQSYPDA
jgi:hypothetical protein